MRNTVKGFLLRLPAIILIILCFIGSLVIKLSASLSAKYPISWAPAIVLFLIIVAYFAGEYFNTLRHSVYAI